MKYHLRVADALPFYDPKPGMMVKLGFYFLQGRQNTEWMWVETVENLGNGYFKGRLLNSDSFKRTAKGEVLGFSRTQVHLILPVIHNDYYEAIKAYWEKIMKDKDKAKLGILDFQEWVYHAIPERLDAESLATTEQISKVLNLYLQDRFSSGS